MTSESRKDLPIQRVMPEMVKPQVCNHFVVLRPNDHEVHLQFYFVRPLVLLGDASDVGKKLQSTNHVDAECVADIVIPASRFQEFHELISSQYAASVQEKVHKLASSKEADQ